MKTTIYSSVILLIIGCGSISAQGQKIDKPIELKTKISTAKIGEIKGVSARKINPKYLEKQHMVHAVIDCDHPVKSRIAETDKPVEIKTFPNPVVSDFTVIISDAAMNKSVYELQLFDLQGKKVFSQPLPINQNLLMLTDLSVGTYVLNIQKNGAVVLQEKLIKQ